MIVTTQQVKNKVYRSMGLDPDDIDTNIADEVLLRINQVQDDIYFDRLWDWRKRKFYMTLMPPYETGTIAITQGSKDVVGTTTVWTDTMKEEYLLVNSKRYKIQTITDGTNLILEAPFPEETIAGESYKIIRPDYVMNPYISSLLSVSLEGREIKASPEQNLTSHASEVGEPSECAITGRTKDDFYNTGTATVAASSTAVAGAGTAWTSLMEGKCFRVNEYAEPFIIKTVTDATNLVLDREYTGESGGGKSYKIDPAGSPIISFNGAPDDYYYIELSALTIPFRLNQNTNISLIPNHAPLLAGAIASAFLDYEDKNPVRIQQAEATYKKAMKQLRDSYKVVKNVVWQSPGERAVRRAGGTSNFNPLAR